MRKEVKLGMVIGGGLVALLVVYLLVTPPGNKKGANLANGDPAMTGSGSSGDVAQPGDLTSDDQVGGKTGAVAGGTSPAPKTGSIPDKKVETPVAAKGTETASGAGNADWNKKLNNGDTAARGTPVAGKAGETAKPEPVSIQGHEVIETGPAAGSAEQHATHYDPAAAWGGGVSTDAPALGSARSNPIRPMLSGGGSPDAIPTQPIPAAPGARTHVIQSGETFSSITAAVYGKASYFSYILQANPTVNPNNIKLGTVIKLPSLDEVKAATPETRASGATPAPADVKIDPARQYKVQSGDSLYRISQKLYGKGTLADRLYDHNKSVIGPDPRRLKLGAILELPEHPLAIAPAASTPAAANVAGRVDSRLDSRPTDGTPANSPGEDNQAK